MEFALAASNSSPLPTSHTGWVILGVTVTILMGIGTLLFKGGSWYGQVNTDRENFKEFMGKVERKIDQILGYVGPQTIVSSSPLRLTDLGKDIARDIQADQWADEFFNKVAGEMSGKSPYEIQEFCFQYTQDFEIPEEHKLAFQSVAYKHGVEVYNVRRVIAVVLRDKLLEHTQQQAP